MTDTGDREQLRLERARNLDGETLAAILDEYEPLIYRYVYRHVDDAATAEDITSDVFHRLLQALHLRRGPDTNLAAWLYRTAHNAIIDHYRRRQHRHHLPLDENLPAPDDDLADRLHGQLMKTRVKAALLELSSDQRQVIMLKYLQGLSNEQVAQVLDKPVGAVKSLQHRALEGLRRRLATAKGKLP